MTDQSHYSDDPAELLIVTFTRPDEDGYGRLHVKASTNGFAGQGSSWCPDEQLLDFAMKLSAYPLPEGQPAVLSRGYGRGPARPRDPDFDYREEVGLCVEPVGSRGQVLIGVHLVTEVEHISTPGRRDNEVHLDLLTTYERLRRFSRHLEMVARNELTEAAIGTEEVGH